MLNIPKLFLQEAVKVEKVIRKTDYGDPIYDEENPILIENVKVDTKTTFSGSRSDRKITKTTTIFIYLSSQSDGFVIDDSFLEARVTDEHQNNFILKSYTPNRYPTTGELWSYEVEVV